MILAEYKPTPEDTYLLYQAGGLGVLGNIFMVNQSKMDDTVRIALVLNANDIPNPDDTPQAYILFDAIITPGHTVTLQGIGIQGIGGLYVYSYNGATSFSFTGTAY